MAIEGRPGVAVLGLGLLLGAGGVFAGPGSVEAQSVRHPVPTVADAEAAPRATPRSDPDGERVYRAACAACHGDDGTGLPAGRVGFGTPLPDFTDCSFASREPDADWVAVAHEGGPTRGFARMMPAFGEALAPEEIQAAVDHIRALCGSDAWPPGELNLPRAMVTEKAYPEDEAVFTFGSALEGSGRFTGEITYEKRFGARNQIEVVVPFFLREVARPAGGDGGGGGDLPVDGSATAWNAGLGDVGIGFKRVLFHSLGSGTILSVTAEAILPTGDESDGLGTGTTVFEPFLSFGWILPSELFLQAQGGLEIPAGGGLAEEAFWRGVLGRSFTSGRWGRVWSPMVEVLGVRGLTSGATAHWDLLPQIQVTLNTRQHVMANVGVRIPVNDTEGRPAELLVYVLWDYFDGGFLAGW